MIDDEKNISRLIQKGLTLISYRMRSQKEIQDRLKIFAEKHHIESSLIAPAVSRLMEMGYINELKFAQWIITSYTGKKAKGTRFLKNFLLKQGITQEIIDSVLPTNKDEEISQARSLIDKKMGVWKHLPSETKKNRIVSYLVRRGFSYDIVYRLVDEYTKSAYNTGT